MQPATLVPEVRALLSATYAATGRPAPTLTDAQILAALARTLPRADRMDEPEGQAAREVAPAGPDGYRIGELLRHAKREGSMILAGIAERAGKRLLQGGARQALQERRLFTDAERQELADAIAATNATAELLGRSRIRLRQQAVHDRRQSGRHTGQARRFSEDATSYEVFAGEPLRPLAPEQALAYFRRLVPKLGVDPERFGAEQRRRAFTVAEATEQRLVERIHDLIGNRLETGKDVGVGTGDVRTLLDEAGVSPRNPVYAETVWRTNMMDALNTGFDEERQHPDVVETFPVWTYSGIRDGRQRPEHEVQFGRYFPARVKFAEVRDAVKGKFDGYNCRCTSIPVDRYEWAELYAGGARIADGYEDVPPAAEAVAHAEPLDRMPGVRQQVPYSCGAAALAAVCNHFELPPWDEARYRQELGTTPEDGTLPEAIVRVARARGLEATIREPMTLTELLDDVDAGRPVIVAIQAWGPPENYPDDQEGHYVVATGHDARHVHVADPVLGAELGQIELGSFLDRWHDRDGRGRERKRMGIVCARKEAAA